MQLFDFSKNLFIKRYGGISRQVHT